MYSYVYSCMDISKFKKCNLTYIVLVLVSKFEYFIWLQSNMIDDGFINKIYHLIVIKCMLFNFTCQINDLRRQDPVAQSAWNV